MIDLYGMASPNVTKVAILLDELGLEYRSHHIAVFRGAQFDPSFTAISPFSKVPVIVDRGANDLTVFESGAILVYLAETHGGREFLPDAGPARYATFQWLVAQTAMVGPLLGQNNHFLLMGDEGGRYAASRYAEQARRIYKVLDDRLAATPWLAGYAYSIADIATYPWAAYVPKHGLAWSDYPSLQSWHDRISARPAVIRAATAIAGMGQQDVATITAATPAELDRFFWREKPGPAADFAAMNR